jgi:hypothetical protein
MKYIHVEGIMYCVHLSIFPQKLGFFKKMKILHLKLHLHGKKKKHDIM